jgi:hypothetical protein
MAIFLLSKVVTGYGAVRLPSTAAAYWKKPDCEVSLVPGEVRQERVTCALARELLISQGNWPELCPAFFLGGGWTWIS